MPDANRTKRKKIYLSDDHFDKLGQLAKVLKQEKNNRTQALAYLIDTYADLAIELAPEQTDIRKVIERKFSSPPVVIHHSPVISEPVTSEPVENSEAFSSLDDLGDI